MNNANNNRSPKIPCSAVVKKMKKWSGIQSTCGSGTTSKVNYFRGSPVGVMPAMFCRRMFTFRVGEWSWSQKDRQTDRQHERSHCCTSLSLGRVVKKWLKWRTNGMAYQPKYALSEQRQTVDIAVTRLARARTICMISCVSLSVT